jgi:hypothetical protein
MDPIGTWVLKEGFNIRNLIRVVNNAGEPGKYLIDLTNGSNAITLTELNSMPGKSVVYRSVVNGGYKTLSGHGPQYVEKTKEEIEKLLDEMSFLKRISL